MVYQGPSRGCNSCRLRRKKCDEARPSCMRCVKARRACGGYECGTSSSMRPYAALDASPVSQFVSTARKCSIPPRVPIPGSNILPEDTIPTEVSEAESNQLALRAFFYDFCFDSANQNLSRGFLPGLERMTYRLGPNSDLVKACLAVSFGSHAKPLRSPRMQRKAEMFYQQLLGSLSKSIGSKNAANTVELKMISMLLGLYQMTATTEIEHGSHDIHARGLAALMNIGPLPLNLVGTSKTGTTSGGIKKAGPVFSVSALSGRDGGLDHLLLELDRAWARSELCDLSDLKQLKSEAIDLARRFTHWEDTRATEFRPTTVAYVSKRGDGSRASAGFWPGKVDTYFDLYVAGAWNVFRAARLLLVGLIIKLSHDICDADGCIELNNAARHIAEDIIASVPYHITDNLQAFLGELPRSTEIKEPGKSLGGLLLMHPLYIVFRMKFLPEATREYTQRCLEWIGQNMGLGQATLLARAPNVDKNYVSSGCLIIWSGFLGQFGSKSTS